MRICTQGRLTKLKTHYKSPLTDTLYGLGLGGQVGDSEWVGFRDLENGLAQIHSLKEVTSSMHGAKHETWRRTAL